MKFSNSILYPRLVKPRRFSAAQCGGQKLAIGNRQSAIHPASAFTMVEIAICLAIIGFAIVAIIGVLPLGMTTQRDNREETVINQDATVLLEAIRNGARSADDLTNYVYAITNYWTLFKPDGTFKQSGVNGYTFFTASIDGVPNNFYRLTNGSHIIGLLSTPEFTDGNYFSIPPQPIFPPCYSIPHVYQGGFSNHIVAYVRALSGLAAEKPPQDNPIMRDDTFSYRLFCVNAPVMNDYSLTQTNLIYTRQFSANQHELRMTFLWPQRPNGTLGNGRQTFRATIAGQLKQDTTNAFSFFYQPQFYRTNLSTFP